EKGYNTRERIRASSLAINLAFSRLFELYEDKIYQLLNAKNFVLSEFLFILLLHKCKKGLLKNWHGISTMPIVIFANRKFAERILYC
ncbi:MAG: hypothetical protein J1E03_13095, partial [Acetatifactor sp.]|nr:hypothetical protein [Acetatifactor sp.]